MRKKSKIILGIIIALILIILVVCVVFKFSFNTDDDIYSTISVKDGINNMYFLDDRDTLVFEQEFYILKNILSSDEIDMELYAISLSKLFIIDFYTLNNKISQFDVGGYEFFDAKNKNIFSSKASDTMYKYVSSSLLSNLPEVKSVTVSDISETDDGFDVYVNMSYVKDLGYDVSAFLKIKKSDSVLEITEIVGDFNE